MEPEDKTSTWAGPCSETLGAEILGDMDVAKYATKTFRPPTPYRLSDTKLQSTASSKGLNGLSHEA